MQRFNIFIKSEKFNWSINNLMLIILVIGFVIWRINEHFSESNYYKEIDKSLMYIFLFAFIGGTLYKFSKIGKTDKLNGKFEGFLEFKNDSIIVDKMEYKIDEIEKIDIINNDYNRRPSGGRGFDSNFSNGEDNHLTIILKNKQKVQCSFELYNQFDLGKIDDILINYYSKEKLNFEQLLRILKVKSKEEIEDLKKFLPKATTTNSG